MDKKKILLSAAVLAIVAGVLLLLDTIITFVQLGELTSGLSGNGIVSALYIILAVFTGLAITEIVLGSILCAKHKQQGGLTKRIMIALLPITIIAFIILAVFVIITGVFSYMAIMEVVSHALTFIYVIIWLCKKDNALVTAPPTENNK